MTSNTFESRWLADAIVALPSTRDATMVEDSPVEVLAADICVVAPNDRAGVSPALFLVIDTAGAWCDAMLVSADVGLATEVDVIVPASESGLGYPVVVHSRYRGPIRVSQVRRRVGAVTTGTLDAVERLSWLDDAPVDVQVGLPLLPDGIDPRFGALRALSGALDGLSGRRV